MEDKKEKILKDINNLEDYEKGDIMIDIFKMLDDFSKLDTLQFIQESNLIDKTCKIELVYSLINTMIEDIKKEYINLYSKKDDGFYNVKAHGLEKEYNLLTNFINEFYEKMY